MASQLQSDTARINGAKSRGPKTAEGRAKSSQNALQHGCTASNTILLACEDPQEFEAVLAGYMAYFRPVDAFERRLVEDMFSAHWRIRRLKAIETALIDYEMIVQKPELTKKIMPFDTGILLAVAFRALADDSRALALASRYESRLQRLFDRTFKMLTSLRHKPKPAELPTPSTRTQPIPWPEGIPAVKNDQTNPAAAPNQAPEATK
jgi:hypothetical protein